MSHSSILIIGGSGKVARRLTSLLSSSSPPYTVHSIIRSEGQVSELKSLGATPHVHDIEHTTVQKLSSLIGSLSPAPTAVVWSAGAGGGNPERTENVDHLGAIKAMDAAAESNIKRFILVSALDVRDKSKPAPDWYNDDDFKTSERLWNVLAPYMKAKLASDRELAVGNQKRDLKWTIVRPGRLTEDDAKGTVDAGRKHLGTPISRSDVAAVIAECLKNDGTAGLAFDVLGGETPIKQAIEEVAEKKIDCFQDFI